MSDESEWSDDESNSSESSSSESSSSEYNSSDADELLETKKRKRKTDNNKNRPKRKCTHIKINYDDEYDTDVIDSDSDFDPMELEQTLKDTQVLKDLLVVVGKNVEAGNNSQFEKLSKEEKNRFLQQEKLVDEYLQDKIPPKYHILLSHLPLTAKAAAISKLQSLEYVRQDSGEYQKINQWIAGLMKIAFGKIQLFTCIINRPASKNPSIYGRCYANIG